MRTVLLGGAAAAVTIAALAVAPLSASAASTYTVSGSITYAGAATSPTDPGTDVRLFPVTGGNPSATSYQAAATVGASGTTWSVSGVPAGKYRILASHRVSTGTDAGTADAWYGATPYEDQATVVTVTHAVTGLTIDRPAAGSISGTVTAASGTPSPSQVTAWLYNGTNGLFERVGGAGGANTTSTGNYTIRDLNPGTYVVRFGGPYTDLSPQAATQYWQSTDNLWASKLVTVTAGQNATGIDGTLGEWSWYSGRLSGDDRFATSAAISSNFFNDGSAFGKGPVAYVASGVDFPDALGASAAAAWQGGPLLLTRPDAVPASIVAELQRLKPSKIVVVGGANAVGASAFAQLTPLAPTVTRISGPDRFATSRAIVSNAFTQPVTSVFIATGRNFPDALVAGSAAGHQYGPLLLVNGTDGAVDSTTKALITSLAPKRIYIVGGPNSVSPGIQADLATLASVPEVVRLSGPDRFATAQAVNQEVFRFADAAYVASGLGFPDALSISAIAGSIGAPLLLAPPQCIPNGEVADSTALGVSTYWVVGGTAVLSPAVKDLTMCPPGAYGSATGATAKSDAVPAPLAPQAADPSTLRGALSAVQDGLRKH